MLRRTIAGLLALVFLAIASLGLLGATWVWSSFGSQGVVSETLGRLTGDQVSQAIVIDVERIGGQIPYIPVSGEVLLIATPAIGAPGPPEMFIAQAPAETVNTYLFGSRYDVGRYEQGEWSLASVPGFRDLDPPQSVSWQNSAVGPSARLPFVADAPTTVIVMNADGSPPVDVLLTVQMQVPGAVTIAVVLAIIGLVMLIIGLLFVRSMLGRGRRRGVHEDQGS